jgi:hypothetical protein
MKTQQTCFGSNLGTCSLVDIACICSSKTIDAVSCCVFASCSQSDIAGMSLAISHPVPANKYHSYYSVRRSDMQASEHQCQHPTLVPVWQRDPVWQRNSVWQHDHVWQRDPFCRQLHCRSDWQRLYNRFRKRRPHFSTGGWQHRSSISPECRRWCRSRCRHVWIARCFVREHCCSCLPLDTSSAPDLSNSNPSHAPDASWIRLLPESLSRKSSCEKGLVTTKTWPGLSYS